MDTPLSSILLSPVSNPTSPYDVFDACPEADAAGSISSSQGSCSSQGESRQRSSQRRFGEILSNSNPFNFSSQDFRPFLAGSQSSTLPATIAAYEGGKISSQEAFGSQRMWVPSGSQELTFSQSSAVGFGQHGPGGPMLSSQQSQRLDAHELTGQPPSQLFSSQQSCYFGGAPSLDQYQFGSPGLALSLPGSSQELASQERLPLDRLSQGRLSQDLLSQGLLSQGLLSQGLLSQRPATDDRPTQPKRAGKNMELVRKYAIPLESTDVFEQKSEDSGSCSDRELIFDDDDSDVECPTRAQAAVKTPIPPARPAKPTAGQPDYSNYRSGKLYAHQLAGTFVDPDDDSNDVPSTAVLPGPGSGGAGRRTDEDTENDEQLDPFEVNEGRWARDGRVLLERHQQQPKSQLGDRPAVEPRRSTKMKRKNESPADDKHKLTKQKAQQAASSIAVAQLSDQLGCAKVTTPSKLRLNRLGLLSTPRQNPTIVPSYSTGRAAAAAGRPLSARPAAAASTATKKTSRTASASLSTKMTCINPAALNAPFPTSSFFEDDGPLTGEPPRRSRFASGGQRSKAAPAAPSTPLKTTFYIDEELLASEDKLPKGRGVLAKLRRTRNSNSASRSAAVLSPRPPPSVAASTSATAAAASFIFPATPKRPARRSKADLTPEEKEKEKKARSALASKRYRDRQKAKKQQDTDELLWLRVETNRLKRTLIDLVAQKALARKMAKSFLDDGGDVRIPAWLADSFRREDQRGS